ncbi:MAG: valine--tRNA ligase [Candidatus Pacearchaeota archaeon]
MEYDPLKEEKKILDFWEKEKIYRFKLIKNRKNKIYSIDSPPPTVSGEMHMGHAFSYSQQDFIARFRRMYEGSVFYPFGTDDNGLPTEKLVEKLNGIRSKDMLRPNFIKICISTLKRIIPDFIQQWKNLGISADYKIYYSTIDKNSQKISQKSFIDLFRNGIIYRARFPSIWCPECQTAIAQAELEDKKLDSFFTTIKFKVEMDTLPIATTRPELIPACVAILIHPEDQRYKKYIGKMAEVPLSKHKVPIIGDKTVNKEKGTGAMMICSYGDKFDVDVINRYKLPQRIIFDYDGTIKDGKYKGLKIKEARNKIFDDLCNEKLVLENKKISHVVNVHDKCGTEIEFLPTDQWFIKILDKKKEWISLGRKIKWYPKYMEKRYENWVKGLNWDWTISRDRYFGIPIPVWWCAECNKILLPNEKELPVDPINVKKICPNCKKQAKPETRVLDTWATSPLTPQIASSLVQNKIKIPYSLRPQGHDIIRTWAFYTIVKSFYHKKNIPWKNIMISGYVMLYGEKMSKSKGNIVVPKEVINKYGADAIRFWAATSKLGEDMEYREEDVIAGKRFVIKLFNASNFVFINLKNYKPKKPKKLEKLDELFLNRLNLMVNKATINFLNYEYSKIKQEFENFFWHDFCDNYLEIIKWRVYNGTKKQKESAFYTLYTSLLTILKIFAPITPFITEFIYQKYFRIIEKEKSIHLMKWPRNKKKTKEDDILSSLFHDISKIRREKSIAKKPANAQIILTLPENSLKKYKEILEDLKNVANAKEIRKGEFNVEFV